MSDLTITALVLLLALGALVPAARSMAKGGKVWNSSTTFTVLAASFLLAPQAFVQLTTGTSTFVDVFGNTEFVTNPRFYQVSRVMDLCVLTLGLVTFLRGVRNRQLYYPLLLAAVLVLVTHTASWAIGASPWLDLRLLILATLLLGACTLPRGEGTQLGIAMVGVGLAVVSALVVLMNFGAAFHECRTDKCGPLGYIFFGAATGENPFALTAASTIPACMLAFRGRHGIAVGFSLLLMVFISGSRTSLFAAVIIFLCGLIAASRSPRGIARSNRLIPAVAWLGVAVGIALPFVTASGAFTGRADLWMLARRRMEDHWLIGHGGLDWPGLVAKGLVSRAEAYSVHNQWLDVIYTGGVIGAVIFVAVLYTAIKQSDRGSRGGTAFLLLPLIYTGMLERTWAFGLLDHWGWLCAATLVALNPKHENDESRDTLSRKDRLPSSTIGERTDRL